MRRIRLTESQLNKVILESVKRIVKESYNDEFNWDNECDEDGVIRTTINNIDGNAEFECTFNSEDSRYIYATAVCVGGDLYGEGYELDIEIDKNGGLNPINDALEYAIEDDSRYMMSRGEY